MLWPSIIPTARISPLAILANRKTTAPPAPRKAARKFSSFVLPEKLTPPEPSQILVAASRARRPCSAPHRSPGRVPNESRPDFVRSDAPFLSGSRLRRLLHHRHRNRPEHIVEHQSTQLPTAYDDRHSQHSHPLHRSIIGRRVIRAASSALFVAEPAHIFVSLRGIDGHTDELGDANSLDWKGLAPELV